VRILEILAITEGQQAPTVVKAEPKADAPVRQTTSEGAAADEAAAERPPKPKAEKAADTAEKPKAAKKPAKKTGE
jgi:hypothetical protein